MCGIAGKLYLDGQTPVESELIQRMTDIIAHRGPDGAGKHLSGPVGLGHRRLSIIDLRPTGAQPMCNEDKTVWIVFNGEIYNYLELRAELLAKGHKFTSTTDTEVIVHLYEEYGEECVTRLRGMFAFALWDERKKFLFLARDRVGIKPLYYLNTGKALLFASEIKSLLVDPTARREVNPRAIDRFLTYYYLPGNETLFKDIYKLEPGHYLTVSNGKLVDREYWDLSFQTSNHWTNIEEAVEALQKLLSRTIKDHLISDVPVGVLLSGGVDSTGVLRYAAEHADKPLNTFTVGFSGASFADERPYAKMAADKFRTIHHDLTVTAQDFRDFLPKYIWHMEEPVCEPPAISLYYVSRLARQSSVKVLLSGEGGDEAFAGYPKYRNLLVLERMKSAFGPARGLLSAGLKVAEMFTGKDNRHYRNCIHTAMPDYYYGLAATPGTPFNRQKGALYKNDFTASLGNYLSDQPTQRLFSRVDGKAPLQKMLYVDTKSWLPDDLLVKADKMTMATSVELRVPLLDHQVLEFAASLPSEFKVRGKTIKRVLRLALQESVPDEILTRKKAGFPLPYDRWLKTELREFVNDTLLAQNSALDSYFHKASVRDMLQKQQLNSSDNRNGGKAQHALDYSREIFSLLVLEMWHKEFRL
ncbi:MAG: asparagine synthase (glutamine-hydrolyzing) [Verrucomicrobia bacterium]|nr:asparagine synthase (glutamine-hydrolyzing) [Verrucomicrobiota bacterium]